MGLLDIFKRTNNAKEEDNAPVFKAKKVKNKVIAQQLYRFNQELNDWKIGVSNWEDPFNPITVDLIRVYNDLVIDSHLSALMEARISKTLSKDYKVKNDKGEEIDDETEIFNSLWFRDFIRISLESKFYGYSLIQFGDRVGKSFKEVKSFRREYVLPQKDSVRRSPYDNTDLIPYNKGVYKPWLFSVGAADPHGLLMKAAPIVIYKKTALGSWTEFAELFGSPFRLGKTNVRDEELRDNMYEMLENMGRNAFGVFDTDDSLEFIRDSKTDSFKVFNELIERSNSELSKLILGSTMTTDDGSSRSQSEVHERSTTALSKDDAFFIEDLVNKHLIPWLNTYHNFGITGKWCFDDTEALTKEQQFAIDIELVKNGFNVPKEYFTETYNTPIDETEDPEDKDPEGGPEKLENSIKKKTLLTTQLETFIDAHSCDICNELDFEDTPPQEWDEDFINKIITGVHTGLYTLEKLPESLYLELGNRITKGLYEGLATGTQLTELSNLGYVKAMRNNAFIFSGAKTFQQVQDMSAFLLDSEGNPRSFKEYKEKAREVFGTYNENWLRTEINTAKAQGQVAEKWQRIEDEKELFPLLQYRTANDERVRDSHQKLNRVTKPVDDPFWNQYTPQNGWNCRCDVRQLTEGEVTADKDITIPEDIPDYMKFNPGKTGDIFSPKHPYFNVNKKYNDFKKDNFGLPEPPKVTDKEIVKEVKKSGAKNWAKEKDKVVKANIISEFKKQNLDVNKVMFKREMDREAMSKQVNQISTLLKEYRVAGEWLKKPFKVSFSSSGSALGYMQYGIRGGRGGQTLEYLNFNVGHRKPGTSQTYNDSQRLTRERITGKSKVDKSNLDVVTTTHEFAHFIAVDELLRAKNVTENTKAFFSDLQDLKREYTKELRELNKSGDKKTLFKIHLGNYANTNINEFMAEGFTEYKLNTNPSKYAKKIGLLIDKNFKK